MGTRLSWLVKQHSIDCVIANVENICDGSGISPPIYSKLKRYGVHLMSMGDHVYKRRDSLDLYRTQTDITRPANLGPDALGVQVAVHRLADGTGIGLFTLLGRLNMKYADCFLRTADQMLAEVVPEDVRLVFVDMHAETSSEKIAVGWYLDGRVTCVFGTHTHVQSADERLLPGATAYISDLGMTGPHNGVLGRRADRVIEHMITNMPTRFDIADGDVRINGVIVEADAASGRALRIERLSHAVPDSVLHGGLTGAEAEGDGPGPRESDGRSVAGSSSDRAHSLD